MKRARAEPELKGKAVAAAVHTLLQGEKHTHNEQELAQRRSRL